MNILDDEQKKALAEEFKEWYQKQENKVALIATALSWAQAVGLISRQKAQQASQMTQFQAVHMWWMKHKSHH